MDNETTTTAISRIGEELRALEAALQSLDTTERHEAELVQFESEIRALRIKAQRAYPSPFNVR